MSNIIPPLLSDTPPPPPDIDDHDEDEFGDFAGPNNLSYDADEGFSPPGSPLDLPPDPFVNGAPTTGTIKTFDINSNKPSNGEVLETPKDFHDKRKNITENDRIIINNSTDQIEFSEDYAISVEIIETNCDIETSNELEIENTREISDTPKINGVINALRIPLKEEHRSENEVKDAEIHNNEGSNSILSQPNSSAIQCETFHVNWDDEDKSCGQSSNILLNAVDDDDGGFNDFISEPPKECNNDEDSDDFGDFTTMPRTAIDKIEVEDDFGDFADFSSVSQTNPSTADDDDDFGDFTFTNATSEKLLFLDEKQALEKSMEVLKEMFPPIEDELEDFVRKDLLTGDKIFEQIKNITDTHALAYQWTKSASQNLLLKSLNIDSRNILYGPGWNPSMPRFAATLSVTPLEPVKSSVLPPTPVKETIASRDSHHRSHSDPIGFGSPDTFPESSEPISTVENIDTTKVESTQKKPPKVEIIKTSDFNEFILPSTSSKGHTITLRETHIAKTADSGDVVNWLEPTIVTPELTRKEVNFVEDNEEFEDFQTIVVPEQIVKTSDNVLTVKALQVPPQINKPPEATEEEFGDFTFSLPTAPSQPVIQETIIMPTPLEPLKPAVVETKSTVQSISWPDPGISDDEIKRFEALGMSRMKQSNKPETKEEEEWSDFVSVQNQSPIHKLKVEKERSSTPDLPLSVLNLGSIQPTRQPIPVITANGLMQTKLATNNSLNLFEPPPNRVYVQPQTNRAHHQPSIISNQYASQAYAGFGTKQIVQQQSDEDEWSDFVSHQPIKTPNYQFNPNIISNPAANLDNAYGVSRPQKILDRNVLMPDLDFMSPKSRTNHRK